MFSNLLDRMDIVFYVVWLNINDIWYDHNLQVILVLVNLRIHGSKLDRRENLSIGAPELAFCGLDGKRNMVIYDKWWSCFHQFTFLNFTNKFLLWESFLILSPFTFYHIHFTLSRYYLYLFFPNIFNWIQN